MNVAIRSELETAHELHYRKNETSEHVFVRSIYTGASGKPVGAAAGDFDDDVGVKAAQICLLNLKLQLEGHETVVSSEHYQVLKGEEAGAFAETLNAMFKGRRDGSKWHQALFGFEHRFLYAQGSSNPVIVVRKECRNRPRKIAVHLVQGLGAEERSVVVDSPSGVREIVQSSVRQIRALREKKIRRNGGPLRDGEQGDTSITHRRSERAWGVLEQHVRDLANPKTPWNRLYAIDRLNDEVWRCAETYAYFGLQAREYIIANYDPQKKSAITFSKPVLDAINRAVALAKRYLPNYCKPGHSLTAFDDWGQPQLDASGKPKFEIARILIWPTERLHSEEAFAVARLHKMYSIPLFYLPPSSVRDEPQDEYILFCKPGDSENTSPSDLRGMAWDAMRRDWKHVGDLHFHPLEHFFTLLKNPKLVFAIDAGKMLQNGIWSSFEATALSSPGSRNLSF